jgi:hypothetical protein
VYNRGRKGYVPAIQIPGVDHETAHILDDFWYRLEPEEKAALVTAF